MSKKPPGRQHPRPSPWKKVLILVLCAAALVLAAVGLRALSDPFPRLEAAGFRISQEEYLRAMYRARNDVLSDHAAAGISLTDWSAETALGDPKGLAMERAVEIIREYYAVSTLAVERGYLADAGYDAMIRDMEELNRNRQEALDSGGVITGMPEFTVDDYITYRASSLRLQFCNDPDNPDAAVSREDIQARYEADRDALYRQADAMELRFVLADGADDGLARSFEELARRARETGDLALALEEMPELKAFYQQISVTSGTYSVYARSHADVLAWAGELEAGEISGVLRQEDRLCLIQCTERTRQQYVPLEEVESVVAQSVRESRYDALIGQRMEEMVIQGDLEALYRFTAEQLP